MWQLVNIGLLIIRLMIIDRIRLTASCKNVCTFDNWEYGDPETGGLATRTFNFGINVTL